MSDSDGNIDNEQIIVYSISIGVIIIFHVVVTKFWLQRINYFPIKERSKDINYC